MRLLLIVLFGFVGSGSLLARASFQIPSKKEQKALLQEFLQLDAKTETGFQRQLQIIERLDQIPLSRPSEVKAWKKTIAKEQQKSGPKLEKKKGTYFQWEEQRRGLFIIDGDIKKPKGLLLGMHGGGVGSGDARTSASAYSSAARKLGWVAIFPEVLEKTERGWTDSGTEEWVMDLVDAALRTWKIDPNSVYFSGHSMGGYGTWTLGGHHADRVAALAPSAGAPTPIYGPSGKIEAIDSGVVPNLRNVPMVVYQSLDDPRVPPDANQAAVARIKKMKERYGGFDNFQYWEVNGRQHDLPPGGTLALLEKISTFHRNPMPQHLVWEPSLPWKHQFYWLWWEKPQLRRPLEAEFSADTNTFSLQSHYDISSLQILLDGRMVAMDREVVVLVNGKETNRQFPQPTLGTLVLTSIHPDPDLQFVARINVIP